mmetsp:Transcript_16032/g.53731  ORF Transcript_16032/g.53731 Transcript_16032/m.53731 type:complete len:352 (+) Transcript_16032:252-1307(+)
MSHHHHLLVPELLRHVRGRGAGNMDPGPGEQSAGSEDEDDVEDGVKGIRENVREAVGRGYVVSETADRPHLPRHGHLRLLPASEKVDEDVLRVPLVQDLRDEVQVGDQGSLEDDGDVAGVEQLDGIAPLPALLLRVLHRKLDPEPLEVDDQDEDKHSSQQVGHVGQVLAVERLLEGPDLVLLRHQQVEQSDQGALELGSSSCVDGGWAERLPDDRLADVGGDEERDGRPKAVPLLQELIQADHKDTRSEELGDEEDGIAGSEIPDVSVHAREHVGHGLDDGDEDTEELLGSLEQSLVLLGSLVNVDDPGASKELHDEAGGDDRADTQLHQRPFVRCQDNAHPVERIRRFRV